MRRGFNHYVSKRAITRGIVEGVRATALCGETLTPKSQGVDAIPGTSGLATVKKETCPTCELLYGALRSEVEEKIEEPSHA